MNTQTAHTDRNLEIANTILAQIGGNRALFMIGDKHPFSVDRGLELHPKGALRGINRITITLEPNDTYTIKFNRYTFSRKTYKGTDKLVAEFSDVYAEDLRTLIESTTGLYLSLGTMGR